MVKLTWADHLRMEANKNKKSIPSESDKIDFYETDILEKASKNKEQEVNNQKSLVGSDDEEHKSELEFHEQFFS